ncbi:hypothetical protein NQZ68_034298, partial [Dissostichus eleginoides]
KARSLLTCSVCPGRAAEKQGDLSDNPSDSRREAAENLLEERDDQPLLSSSKRDLPKPD